MATIKGLTIEIGGNTTKLTKALGDVNRQSRDLKSELRDVERLLKLDPGNTELIAQKQKILAESIENTAKKLETLKEAERQAQQQFQEGKIGEDQYRAIQREVIKTEEELKKLNGQLKEMDWKGITDGLDKFGKKSTDIGKNLSKKVTAPILGIGVAAAKIGMDFEQSMSKVEAMSGATAEEMERLEKAAREAGANTSKSASDAADALGYMALAGWDVNTSIEGLMPVLRLSEAGNIDLAKASSLVTDSMSAMGIEVQDLDKYLDIVAQTARNSNTDIDQMAEAYLGVGGTLRGLNIELDESALALGLMANAGIKGSEAGTSLNAVLLNLTAPAGRAKQALEDLGYSAFDNEGNFKGLEQVLFELKDQFAEMDTETRNMYLSMIGGKEHVDTLNALLNGLGDSYEDLKGSIMEADGALSEVAETVQDNNKGALTELMSALEELALKIYDVLKPAIESLIDFIQDLVDWLNSLSPEMQKTIVVVAGLAAAIGPLLIIVGKMSTGLSALIKLFAPMVAGLGGATGATTGLSAVITAITGPIGIAVAAIAGITAIIVTLYKTNETARDLIKSAWESMKATIENITNVIKGIIQLFISFFKGDWEGMKEAISKIWTNLWDGLKNALEGSVKLIGSIVVGLMENISNIFSGMISDAFNWGKNLIGGFVDGIKSMASAVSNAVKGVVGNVKDFLGFNSPAKKGEGRFIVDWGQNMIEGFIDGINMALPELEETMGMAIPNMGQQINNTTTNNYGGETSLNLVVKLGEDTITEKMVSNINRQSRINGKTVVEV